MGCNNCNQTKETVNKNVLGSGLNQLVADDYQGHFGLKVVTFIVLLIAIPLIIVVLILQVFGTFFVPTSLDRVKKSLSGWFRNGFESWAERKAKKTADKRRKQFFGNKEYTETSPGEFTTEDGSTVKEYYEDEENEEEEEDYKSDIEIHEEEAPQHVSEDNNFPEYYKKGEWTRDDEDYGDWKMLQDKINEEIDEDDIDECPERNNDIDEK